MAAEASLGVVPAGGAGSRVGSADKGLLPLAGKPLIEHLLVCMRAQCDCALIVANRNPDRYASYAPALRDAGAGRTDPLAGLLAAFDFVAANPQALPHWLLTLPVDFDDANDAFHNLDTRTDCRAWKRMHGYPDHPDPHRA